MYNILPYVLLWTCPFREPSASFHHTSDKIPDLHNKPKLAVSFSDVDFKETMKICSFLPQSRELFLFWVFAFSFFVCTKMSIACHHAQSRAKNPWNVLKSWTQKVQSSNTGLGFRRVGKAPEC